MHLRLVRAPGTRMPPGVPLVLRALARRLSPPWLEVQLVLAGDQRLRRLNRDFRGRDRTTDVLAFLYDTSPRLRRGEPHAEVYVSMQRARLQARSRGHALADELVLLVLHGLLHLQGHAHETPRDAGRMRAAEVGELRWLGRRFGWRGLHALVDARGGG